MKNIGLTSAASHMSRACYTGKFTYEVEQANVPLNLLSPAVFNSNCASIHLLPVCTGPTQRL